jgi:ribosomal protein S8E
VDDNYNFSIPRWVDENYPRNYVYAQVNVLEKALIISTNNKSRRIKKIEKIQNIEVTILRI